MQLGQLPVTCGLFFSLGHSTIVVIFIVAIAISTNIFDKAGGFGDVGGIIGEDPCYLSQYMVIDYMDSPSAVYRSLHQWLLPVSDRSCQFHHVIQGYQAKESSESWNLALKVASLNS